MLCQFDAAARKITTSFAPELHCLRWVEKIAIQMKLADGCYIPSYFQ
jgi:hypothetical protein